MQEKDILGTLEEPERLIENEYFYKYIFKKTEKIVCAVFYILAELRAKDDMLRDSVEREALAVLSFIGRSLSLPTDGVEETMRTLVLRLTLLESKLRVLSSARLLPRPHLDVFVAEIDAAIRSIRGMQRERAARTERRSRPQQIVEAPRPLMPKPAASDSVPDRRSRIAAILRAQPGASIKDISDTITDCSVKTIQRELNDMIRDGIVIREGEKRWSTYSIAG
jgi:hypothetical protein